MTEEDLLSMEARLARAIVVAPLPWVPWLETAGGQGGETFIQFGGESDNELYLGLRLAGRPVISPDERLDAVAHVLGNAPADLAALIREVRRLWRTLLEPPPSPA